MIMSKLFLSNLLKVSYSCSVDNTRPAMKGVKVSREGELITLIATSGHILNRIIMPVNEGAITNDFIADGESFLFTFDNKILKKMLKSPNKGYATMNEGNRFILSSEGVAIEFKNNPELLLQYPNTNGVVPKDDNYENTEETVFCFNLNLLNQLLEGHKNGKDAVRISFRHNKKDGLKPMQVIVHPLMSKKLNAKIEEEEGTKGPEVKETLILMPMMK